MVSSSVMLVCFGFNAVITATVSPPQADPLKEEKHGIDSSGPTRARPGNPVFPPWADRPKARDFSGFPTQATRLDGARRSPARFAEASQVGNDN